MKELVWWGIAIAGVCLLEVLTAGVAEAPKKTRKRREEKATTASRLTKSLYGPGNYDGPGCWKRGQGYTG